MHSFSDLALGTRFTYPEQNQVWVKIGYDEIAKWDDSQKTTRWVGQQICSFTEENLDIVCMVNVL